MNSISTEIRTESHICRASAGRHISKTGAKTAENPQELYIKGNGRHDDFFSQKNLWPLTMCSSTITATGSTGAVISASAALLLGWPVLAVAACGAAVGVAAGYLFVQIHDRKQVNEEVKRYEDSYLLRTGC